MHQLMSIRDRQSYGLLCIIISSDNNHTPVIPVARSPAASTPYSTRDSNHRSGNHLIPFSGPVCLPAAEGTLVTSARSSRSPRIGGRLA